MTAETGTGRLEWPAPWQQSSRPLWLLLTAVFAVLTVGVIATGVVTIMRGETTRGTYLIFGSVFFIVATALIYSTRARGRPRSSRQIHSAHLPEVDAQAVIVPYSGSLQVLYALSMTVAALFFGFLAVGALAIGVDEGFGVGQFIMLLVSGGITAYALWFLVDLALRKIRRGFVALTPTGIYHRSWALRGFFPWSDVIGVRAVHVGGPMIEVSMAANTGARLHRTSHAWLQSESRLAPHLVIRTNWLAVDPALLYHALRHYQADSTARPELGREAGAQRLREQRFTS